MVSAWRNSENEKKRHSFNHVSNTLALSVDGTKEVIGQLEKSLESMKNIVGTDMIKNSIGSLKNSLESVGTSVSKINANEATAALAVKSERKLKDSAKQSDGLI